MNRHPGRLLGSARMLLGAGALAALAGCLDLALVSDVAFPPTIAGLDPQQPWIPLPVRSWVTEGSTEAAAIAGCFDCTPRAAVGIFRSTGADPRGTIELLSGPDQAAGRLSRTLIGRSPGAKPIPPVATDVQPFAEKGWNGVVVRIARQDGTRSAGLVALARREGGGTTLLLVVSDRPDAARRIASEVLARRS